MDFSRYDEKTNALIRQSLQEQQRLDPHIFKTLEALKRIARKSGDDALMGFVYYRLADANYSQEISYSAFLDNIRKSIFCFVRAGETEMLARAYNFIGIDAAHKGCYDVAYHYYMTGMRACDAIDAPYVKSIITANTAQLYQFLGDQKRAMRMYRKSARLHKMSKEAKDDVYAFHNLINDIYGEGCISILTGDNDNARKCLAKIEQMLKDNDTIGVETAMIAITFFRAQVAFVNGDKKLFKQRLDEIMEMAGDVHQIFDFADDITMFCRFLLDQGLAEPVRVILDSIYSRVMASGVIRMQRMVADIEVGYYETIGNKKMVTQQLKKLHELIRMQETEQNRIYLFSMELIDTMDRLREEQDRIRKENEQLQQQAMTDVLTGIPNRLAMNKMLESAFERAYAEKHSLGIEILDIDHFKEYNDTYGHQKGDSCLQRVAREIQQIASHPSIHCARYGGDEFVLIFEDMRDEEVLGYARKLEKRIAALKIPHEASVMMQHVSISQGICNAVPTKKNKLWDFLTEADEALYSVKEEIRNGIIADSVCLRSKMSSFG